MIHFADFIDSLLWGALMTVQLAIAGFIVAILLGLLGAAAKMSNSRLIYGMAALYTYVFRGVPELIVILAVYFGSSLAISSFFALFGIDVYVELNPFEAGVLALGLCFGAYTTEVFRAAIKAIPHGEVEAAQAFGMTKLHIYLRIIMPQVWRYALPGLGNLFLVLLKDTSLVSVISMHELMRATQLAVSFTKAPFTFYFTAALLYLGMTLLAMSLLHVLEKRTHVRLSERKDYVL